MNRSGELVYIRETILHIYISLISFITVIGIGGNVLVIFVVIRFSRMQSITNIQIVSLAIADVLHLSAIPQLLLQITGHSFIPSNVACMAYCFITNVNWFAGTLTLTTMSFDRFLAIIYPFKSQKLRSHRNALIAVGVTWIMAVILMIPTYINAKLNNLNSSRIICTQRWTNRTAELALLPTIAYTFIFGYAIPGLLILSFYVAIISRLRQRRRKKQERNQSISSSNKTTILVFMIVIVFLLCNLPYWINQWQVIIYHNQNLQKHKYVITLLQKGLYNHTAVKEYISWAKKQKMSMNFNSIMISYFCQMSIYLNSALNPILYSFFSDQFRTSFAEVISCKCFQSSNSDKGQRFKRKYLSDRQKSITTSYGNSKRNISNVLYDPPKNGELHIFETNL